MRGIEQMRNRFWSVGAVALILFLLVAGSLLPIPIPISRGLNSEPIRAMVSILCITLLVHAWFRQRAYTRTWHELVLVTLLLSLPALAFTWLGLNVIRSYSYDGEQGFGLYWVVVQLQDIIIWCGEIIGVIAVLWSLAELGLWVIGRHSPSHARP